MLEGIAWATGSTLLLAYGAARADAEIGRRVDISAFEAGLSPDQTRWSRSRQQAYRGSLAAPAGAVLGVLRVPSVDLEVPVYGDTSELHLNRGVGLIGRMTAPNGVGNLGIAGHRDGFFRVLAHVRAGDMIEVQTRQRRFRYRVAFIAIVTARDSRLLAPTPAPVVTLVTCFPFYFVGPAPHRFIVRGVRVTGDAAGVREAESMY